MKKFQELQSKREFVRNKIVVGIDPAKRGFQAVALNPNGVLLSTPFKFDADHHGLHHSLWNNLSRRLEKFNTENLLFAVETSCNLWQPLCFYLHECGYRVLLVSPLTTKHSRPLVSHDFSRTDPKDALLMASNARDGYYDFYEGFTPHSSAMHRLSITYDKLRKNYVQNRLRIRALIEQVFPEFFKVLNLDTLTAKYLVKRYFLPQHYIEMDIEEEAGKIKKVSQRRHGKDTLLKLKELAIQSIGIRLDGVEITAARLSLECWLSLLETIEEQMKIIIDELIRLAKETPYFKPIVSVKGISEKLTALFIAETRDLSSFKHYKQIEKLAGLNLRQSQSGDYVGARYISRIGNRRLRWILYKMAEETVKYIPEVRVKYLRRQLSRRNYRKNIVASIPQVLKLIMVLNREQRAYANQDTHQKELRELEERYGQIRKQQRKKAA
jgi:transposase